MREGRERDDNIVMFCFLKFFSQNLFVAVIASYAIFSLVHVRHFSSTPQVPNVPRTTHSRLKGPRRVRG